ncbi:MAG: YqeG family HAD IIIA-type phosphatase [Bacilli bacterium]|nr:YqeG family HAD IIIA-type phosphatase [Bacilli bacterium]
MSIFIPHEYHKSIHDIDLLKLYENGKRLILTDLDNTLVSYAEPIPTEEIRAFKKKCDEIGLTLVIISNNNEKRVKRFADELGVPYLAKALKPLKRGYRKLTLGYSNDEVAIIGDQVLTDIVGGKRMGFYTILVDVIDYKTESWKTRFNRFFERLIIKKYNIKGDKHGRT